MSRSERPLVSGGGASPNEGAAASMQRVVVIASLTRSLVNFRLELLAGMVAGGHEVTALAPDDDPQSIGALSRAGIGFRRIAMARTGSNPIADIATLASIHREIRRLAPDVVVAYTMKPIIYGSLAARLAGVRKRYALFTGMGYVFSGDRNGPRATMLRWLSVALYRRALVGLTSAFAYNEADAQDIRRHRMIDARTPLVMVPGSGVNLDQFAAVPVPAGPAVFLLVARLLREKGIAEFAEAAKRLKRDFPDARFQVLGPFDPSPLGITRDELDRWHADGSIEYLGETTDVAPFLAAATVFVLPSTYREGIPRSALEALSTGRAVVTTNAPGCRDTVVDGRNGFLVPPKDPAALADAMRAFLLDETLAGRMGAQSRRLAQERFDVRIVADGLIRAFGLRSVAADRDERDGAHWAGAAPASIGGEAAGPAAAAWAGSAAATR
ncbi:glycosyltransferase family 4 protein [Aureimonas sp. AU22]|uniref:glycosyltransferase family 4 protein n=1 Tax=Aureimonas sp. AU22 TaxID=1638162 RepID=UPI000AC93662|nr:glycosyltransferase family 4 protein [Aureimonas sp. AU22]